MTLTEEEIKILLQILNEVTIKGADARAIGAIQTKLEKTITAGE